MLAGLFDNPDFGDQAAVYLIVVFLFAFFVGLAALVAEADLFS